MKKILLLFIALFSISFLTSCMKVEGEMFIKKDSTVDGKLTIDVTMYRALSQSLGGDQQTSTDNKTACELLDTDEVSSINYSKSSCKDISDNVAEITVEGGDLGSVISKKDGLITIDLSSPTNAQQEQSKEELENSIKILKTFGFEFNYIYHFPYKIKESNVGKIDIDNNTLLIDVYDIYSKDINGQNSYVTLYENEEISVTTDNYQEQTQETKTLELDTSFENKSKITKELILLKSKLTASSSGKKIVAKLDSLVNPLNNEKLEALTKKINSIPATTRNNPKVKDIFRYLEIKIQLKKLNNQI